jgi:putative acetyltransferase
MNQRAFEQDSEANIVDALRANGAAMLSLVAIVGGEIVGHIMHSPVDISGVTAAALGPMAVVPAHQRRGIGSRLVDAGSDRLARAGVPAIVVVGHPVFYPRFGFTPASRYGIRCEWPVPDERTATAHSGLRAVRTASTTPRAARFQDAGKAGLGRGVALHALFIDVTW